MTDASDLRLKMQDPRTQYPQPPFPRQPQEAPGLAQAMNPKPDHGETSYRGHGRLDGRKALVTGADSGIGRAAAIAFAREGADVALSFVEDEMPDAKEVAKLIEAEGRKAVLLPGDITDKAFCETLVRKAVTDLGGLDILVNNAGKQTNQKDIGDITDEQFDRTLKTNLYAMFWITKAALPHMPPALPSSTPLPWWPTIRRRSWSTTRPPRPASSPSRRPSPSSRSGRESGERRGAGSLLDGPAAVRRPAAGER